MASGASVSCFGSSSSGRQKPSSLFHSAAGSPIFITSPFLRARPSTPPIFARIYVERLFMTGRISTPPAKQRFPRQPFPFGPLKVRRSPSLRTTARQEPTALPFTLNPRSAPAKTAAPAPFTSISGPNRVTSRAAASSGLPSIAFPSLSAGRSIAPATGTPLD